MALLSDKALSDRFKELIEDGSPEGIKHCAYMLLPDRVFTATTGSACSATQLDPLCYRIEPGALVWIRTKEIVKVPHDLCGIWSQTNHYAQRGLMLINASIVEPGYRGPLTGALVNFGRTARVITPTRPFARIMYASLDQSVREPLRMNVDRSVYDSNLLETLEDAPATFMNLGSLHKDLVQIVKEAMVGQEHHLETVTTQLAENLKAQGTAGVADAKKEAIQELTTKRAEILSEFSSKIIKPVNAVLVGFAALGILVGALKVFGADVWIAKSLQPVDFKTEVDKAVEQSLGKRALVAGVTPAEIEALRTEVHELTARFAASASTSSAAPTPAAPRPSQ